MTFWQKASNILKKTPKWCYGLAMGMVCLVAGYYGGQFADIYRKAIMICLECIGIG